MGEVVLALAASARDWSDRLHGFLVDHGGARVRTVVMGPEEVVAEDYDVLVVDDICSFLTPHLVERVRRAGRLVVGVFDPIDGVDAKRRLIDCGVDDVIEADADPDEFLAAVRQVRRWRPPALDEGSPPVESGPATGRVVSVGAPPGGCGATEISIGLAREYGTAVIDADDLAPSVAQRLGAGLHPNLRTAIDVVHHRSGDLDDVTQTASDVTLVAGLARGDDWSHLVPGEVETVVDELAVAFDPLVVNVASGLERPDRGEGRFALARSLISRSDVVVGTGSPTPVGVTRLIRWLAEARVLSPSATVVAVVNRIGRSAYRRSEIQREIGRVFDDVPVVFVPDDPRVEESAWAGGVVDRGPYRRAVRTLRRQVGR